jgi:hypothetical protein
MSKRRRGPGKGGAHRGGGERWSRGRRGEPVARLHLLRDVGAGRNAATADCVRVAGVSDLASRDTVFAMSDLCAVDHTEVAPSAIVYVSRMECLMSFYIN